LPGRTAHTDGCYERGSKSPVELSEMHLACLQVPWKTLSPKNHI
jgi:hypothetical protein